MLLTQYQLLHTVPGVKPNDHSVSAGFFYCSVEWGVRVAGHGRGKEKCMRWDSEESQATIREAVFKTWRERVWSVGRDDTYLFHVCLSHVNVSIHLLKVLLCSVCLFAVPLKFSFTLKERSFIWSHTWIDYSFHFIMDVTACTDTSNTFQAKHCAQQRSFNVTDTALGSVKVCSLQIKQMFIVVICVQKNNHSFNPPLTPPSEQLVFVGPACTVNSAYLPRTQWDHWASAQRSLRRTGQLWMSLTLFLSPCQRGLAEIRRGVLCNLLLSVASLKQSRDCCLHLVMGTSACKRTSKSVFICLRSRPCCCIISIFWTNIKTIVSLCAYYTSSSCFHELSMCCCALRPSWKCCQGERKKRNV